MASILFLGTAGSSAVVNKQLRSSGGIIVQVEDLQFHLDPGPGALGQAKEYGVNLQHNTAICVSHNHINHCNDLNAVIDAMTHSGIEHRGIVLGSKSVLQDSEISHPYLTKHHQNLVEKIIPLEKNHKVGIELIEINALSAEHTDETAIGFKFFCPKFTLSYTGDTKLTSQLIEELTGTDVLILNVPYPGDKAKGSNLDTESAIKIISQVRPKLAVLTHFGLEMLRADPLQEAREIQRITGVQTISAKDGLLISPQNYGKARSPVRGYD
jgi:ribonuclease BN (tRNA processing enzyme)